MAEKGRKFWGRLVFWSVGIDGKKRDATVTAYHEPRREREK